MLILTSIIVWHVILGGGPDPWPILCLAEERFILELQFQPFTIRLLPLLTYLYVLGHDPQPKIHFWVRYPYNNNMQNKREGEEKIGRILGESWCLVGSKKEKMILVGLIIFFPNPPKIFPHKLDMILVGSTFFSQTLQNFALTYWEERKLDRKLPNYSLLLSHCVWLYYVFLHLGFFLSK